MAASTTFRSLHERSFRLFFVGQIISQVGNWMTLVAQVLLVLRLTGNGLAIGALAACQFAPVLLLGPWAGLVADRSDKRRLLLVVQSCAMAQSGALAVLGFAHHPALWLFYAVALAGGVATAFDNPTRRSFVVELVPEAQVQNAVSLNSALMTSSRIVGPALAGLVADRFGFGWCFLADAISYIAVLVALAMIRPADLRPAPPPARGRGQVRAGFAYARSQPALWVPLVMMALIGTLSFNFNTVIPLFVHRSLGGGDTTFTYLFSVLSLGSLTGALLSARRRAVVVRDVAVAAAAFGVAMGALAAAPTLAWSFPIGFFVGLASIGFMTTCTTIVQVRADPSMRGRVLALQSMVFLGSTPIGGPLLGWTCDRLGARAGLLVGAAAAVVAGAYGLLAVRRAPADDRPTVPAPTAAAA